MRCLHISVVSWPKFEQDTDVGKLLNLYIYIFKELVQISREIIFEIINNVGLISEIYQSIPSSRNPHRSKFFYFWVTFFQFKPHFESHFSKLAQILRGKGVVLAG